MTHRSKLWGYSRFFTETEKVEVVAAEKFFRLCSRKSCIVSVRDFIIRLIWILISSFDGKISRPHQNSTFTHYATTLSNIDNQIVALGSGSGSVGTVARNNQGFSYF